MQPLDIRRIRPGDVLEKGLYTRHGIKLLGAGARVSEGLLRALREMPASDLFFADSIEELQRARMLSPAKGVEVGQRTNRDLVTVGGFVVAEEGDEIDPLHSQVFDLGAYTGLGERETARARAQRIKLADRIVSEHERKWAELALRIPSGVAPIRLADQDEPGWGDEAWVCRVRAEGTERFRDVLTRIVAGVATEVDEANAIIDDLMERVQRCPSQFPQLAVLGLRTHDDLAEHAYTTAVLSIAIACRLRWTHEEARIAGLTGLLCDVGMGLIPQELRTTDRPLNDAEINRIWRHPAMSVVLLDGMRDLPEIVRFAAYQHHERENGTGYPNYRKGARITDFAKVASVADAYCAGTLPRTERKPRRPYDALAELIMLGAQGMYDRRIIRALAEAVGLYPIGSFVRLSSGDVAQVMGVRAGTLDRPLVRVVQPISGGGRVGEVIDLSRLAPGDLSIIQATEGPGTGYSARVA